MAAVGASSGRRLAERGHFPAIDVLRSISRLMNDISSPAEQQATQMLRRLLATLQENEDLLSIGAYRQGANRELDVAVAMRDEIYTLFRQQVDQHSDFAEVRTAVVQLAQKCAQQLTPQTAVENS